ncbi:MAG TPA: 5-formyltetrahydrofolate cyclo-ligase [Rhodobiaceae bacterium]|nr:5-formyltetrahydrofolate cyclo-ligase [Rhodobiaceae bacterium]|tara:strand:+ start:1913 stop:2470 length:558 start_codon:yes stop_codon:yes gene_type:complete
MDEKDTMRQSMLAARRSHADAQGGEAAALTEHAEKMLGHYIAAYLPIGGEIDPRPLMQALRRQGSAICLPVCADDEAAMIFRCYCEGDALIPDEMGNAAPRATAQQVTPDIVLLPLLAFDGTGNRLGRGGGFYDRTLAKLRRVGACRFIGLAFDMQMVDKCTVEPHDEALHGVATPTQWHDFDGN